MKDYTEDEKVSGAALADKQAGGRSGPRLQLIKCCRVSARARRVLGPGRKPHFKCVQKRQRDAWTPARQKLWTTQELQCCVYRNANGMRGRQHDRNCCTCLFVHVLGICVCLFVCLFVCVCV